MVGGKEKTGICEDDSGVKSGNCVMDFKLHDNHELRWYRGETRPLFVIFFNGGIGLRKFEKISYSEFVKVFGDNKTLYDDYMLPKRATKNSAGYDFYAIKDYVIKPGEILKIPTGIKVCMSSNEFLMLVVRSSMGFKWNVRLTNQVGIIDSDYYNNESNEGHMYFSLQNEGENEYVIKKGTAYGQGIFLEYKITSDDEVTSNRVGGLGSTSKEKEGKLNE